MKPAALVVENDASTRRLLDVLLTRSGIEADVVPTGHDALLLLERVAYDLVLLDFFLPGLSGMDVLQWISERRPSMLARTAVLTSAMPQQTARVHELFPRVSIIRKPFELNEILEVAQRVTASVPRRGGSLDEEFARLSVRAGAKAGVVLLPGAPSQLTLVTSFGYQPDQLDEFLPLRVDAPYPISIAYRRAQPVWLASVAMAAPDYPLLVPVWRKNESRALAALPVLRDGAIAGVAGWSFREPRLFSEAEQERFLAIAHFLAAALPLPSASRAGA